MAVDELMDLYVNPKRSGGGYSIIEAFSVGIPGVTLRNGDIAAAALQHILKEAESRELFF